MEYKRNRLLSADLLKLLAIFLVLWGHCLQQFLNKESIFENNLYVFIYSFHMPLFMVISGFFSLNSLQQPFRDVVLKKARQLLLPVFSWGIFIFLLYLVLDVAMSEYFTIYSPADAFSKAFDNFWFLKSLFLCYMLAWCSKRTGLSVPLWVILSLIISQLFPFYNVKVMYPCFLFGVFVRHYSQCIERYKIPLFLFSFTIFVIMSLFWNGDFLRPANLVGALRNGDTYAVMSMLYIRLYRTLIGISASLSLYILFTGLLDRKSIGDDSILGSMAKLGTYTLGIYILQVVLLEILLGAFVNCDSLNAFFFRYVVAPFSSAAIMLLCVFIYRFICRSRLLSYLLFGNSLLGKDCTK